MVIVMPPLSQRYYGEPETILTVIASDKTRASNNVCQRIDAESPVVQKSGADTESPDEHLQRVCVELRKVHLTEVSEASYSAHKEHGRDQVICLKPA